MSEELLYTSAARGLKAGSRGFCTVEATAGMPPTMAQLLESLSGYRHLHAPGDPSNAVVLRHVIATVAGVPTHILSRIADAGLDYSGRSNKIAHHLAATRGELNDAGPAWTQLQDSFHQQTWSGETKTIPAARPLPAADVAPSPCRAWGAVTGDAGWAGVLAGAVATGSLAPLPIVVRPDQDILGLIAESIALLPPGLRWQATYTTFHTQLPPGAQCAWRFVLDGTKEAEEILKRRDRNHLDFRKPLGPPSEGPWVEAARTGERPTQKAAPAVEASAYPTTAASPFVEEPAGLAAEVSAWESTRPPPPPPGRRVPYGTRGDFGQSSRRSSKRSIGPIVVTLIAVFATGGLGGLVVWTMDPLGRVATDAERVVEESQPVSDPLSADDPPDESETSRNKGKAEAKDLTNSKPAESVQDATQNTPASRASSGSIASPAAKESSGSVPPSTNAMPPEIQTPSAPAFEKTTFFNGERLLVGREPNESQPEIVIKSDSDAVKDTALSFVAHVDDANRLEQSESGSGVRIGQKDDISSPDPFMVAVIKKGSLGLRKLRGPRPRLASLAIRLEARDGSPPEIIQFQAPTSLMALVGVEKEKHLSDEMIDRFLGQNWLIPVGSYIEADDLFARVGGRRTGGEEVASLKFRNGEKATDPVRLSIETDAASESLLRRFAAARSRWESVRHGQLQIANQEIETLEKAKRNPDPQQLRLLEAKSDLLGREFDRLLNYILEARADNVVLAQALSSLSNDVDRADSRFPSCKSPKWRKWKEGSRIHEKLIREARKLQGDMDVLVRATVLSDHSACELVIATTRDIPEATRE